ncbi:MAG: carboxypeptidase-like regulatory domain-containing protein [Candidatus Hydrogenedentota bacterium]
MQQNLRFTLILLACLGLVVLVWVFLHADESVPRREDDTLPPPSREALDEEPVPSAPSPHVPRSGRIDRGVFGGRVSVPGRPEGHESVYPGVILGRIRAYDGAPAANATVAVLQTQGQNPFVPPERPVSRTTQTDSDGGFEIAGLPIGRYSVLGSSVGYAEVEQAHLTIKRPVADFDIKLATSGHVGGVVRDTEEKPVAGATLWAMQPMGMERFGIHRLMMSSVGLPMRLLLVPGSVTSDTEGKFRFEGLPQASTYVLAMPENAPAVLAGPAHPPFDGLDIELTPGGGISGTVLLSGPEEPVEGVAVIANGPTPREHFEAKTTAEGRFDFTALRPGTYELAVDDERYASAQGMPPRVQVREGTVDSGIVVRLVPAAGISGRVYDKASQKPLPGMYVSARGEGLLADVAVETGRDGSYAITGIGPGDYRVFVVAPSLRFVPGSAAGNEASVTLEQGQALEGLDFGISFGGAIRGVVVDENGAPVSHADVTIGTTQGGRMRIEKTDAQGFFSAAGLTPGETLMLQARKLGLVTHEPVRVDVPPQGSADDVTLVVSKGAIIQGQVVRSSGAPVEGAPVYIRATQASFLRINDVQATGREGTFAWDGLPTGGYKVGVVARGSREDAPPPTVEVSVAAGEQSEPIKLIWDGADGEEESLAAGETGNRAIRGRVTDEQGNPVSGVNINARSSTGYAHMTKSLHDGAFEIAGIAPGTYLLRAFHRDFAPAEGRQVQAGAQDIVLVLQPSPTASGQVFDAATGQPIKEFELAQAPMNYLERQSSLASLRWQRVFDPEGLFTVDVRLSRDPRVLIARADGYAPEQQSLGQLTAGQEITNLVFRLKSGAIVEGTVRDASGKAVPGASIFEGREKRRGSALARSDAQGVFRAEGLQGGTVELTAFHPSYAPDTVTVNTRLGAVTTAEFLLSLGGTVEGYVLKGGQPVSRQTVSLIIEDRHENAVTDANGYYVFESLPAGVGTVTVNLRGPSSARRQFMRAERSIIVADNRVTQADFEFSSEDAIVEGVVTVEGTPVSNAYVALSVASGGGDQRTGTNVEEDGYYRLENLSSGSAILEVTVRSGRQRRSKTVTFEIPAGQHIRQDIDFGPTSVITGTVRGVRKDEQAHVAVLPGEYDTNKPTLEDVQALAGMLSGYTEVSSDGTFVVENLEPGTYTVVGVAITGTPQTELEAFLNARYVTETIEIEPETPLEINPNL